MRRRWISCAGSLALAAGLAGCSDAPAISGSMEEATAKGVVRVRGKAVNNGIVSFRTANVNRPNAPLNEAKIGEDGTYSVRTLVGANFVEVSCKEIYTPKNRSLMDNEQMIDLTAGENQLDLDLPPAPKSASR